MSYTYGLGLTPAEIRLRIKDVKASLPASSRERQRVLAIYQRELKRLALGGKLTETRLNNFTGDVGRNPDGTVVIIGTGPKPPGARVNPISYGTSHFVSRGAAIRYYRDYGYDDTAAAVDRKIREGEIHIGKPALKPGQRLTTVDGGKRYAISENPAGRRSNVSRNGRSFVSRGESVPRGYEPKAGEVWYLGGRKAIIKRVGVSDGTPYVWFVRPVDGTLAMSVANLIQAAKVQRNPGKRSTLKRVGKALAKYVRGNPGMRTFDVHVPATRYDKGYRLTIKAKTISSARAEAKRYCANSFAKYTGRPASQYKLPAKTKVVEI